MSPWIWIPPTTAPTWSPTTPSSTSTWIQTTHQPFWRIPLQTSMIGSLGIPPMRKFSMLLSKNTKMHLMKQDTSTRWSSIQMWGKKLVKPSQEEETEVGRLLNSVPPFHLMWKLMLEPTSLRLWRNASPATTNSTKFAIGTPSSWTTIGQKRPTLDVVSTSKNVLENIRDQ